MWFHLCSGVGWNTFTVWYSPSSLRNPLLRLNWMPTFLTQPWIQEARFVQYEKIILKSLKNCFLWFNHVAVFTFISWNHYTEIFMNFGIKHSGFYETDSIHRYSVSENQSLIEFLKLNPQEKKRKNVLKVSQSLFKACNNLFKMYFMF